MGLIKTSQENKEERLKNLSKTQLESWMIS